MPQARKPKIWALHQEPFTLTKLASSVKGSFEGSAADRSGSQRPRQRECSVVGWLKGLNVDDRVEV